MDSADVGIRLEQDESISKLEVPALKFNVSNSKTGVGRFTWGPDSLQG